VCIAARHPKWDERPLLLVVKKSGSALTADELLAFFDGRVAKWWKPDAVIFVESVPLGATGKVLKHRLREQYADYYLSA
jgi:fatty-acyl-CoA synthase